MNIYFRLLFVLAFITAKIRSKLFELFPETYRRYYFQRTLCRAKKVFPYYRNEKWPVMNKALFLQQFAQLNTLGLTYESCLEQGLAQEQGRDFSDTGEGYSIGLSSGTSGRRGIFLTTAEEQIQWAGTLMAHLPWFLPILLTYLRTRKDWPLAFFLRASGPLYDKVKFSGGLKPTFFDLYRPWEHLWAELIQLDPMIVVAPPYLLEMILPYKRSDPQCLPRIKLLVSVADVLTPELAKDLRETFKVPLHQIYQATEGFLATTCKYERLHLNEDLVHFEFVTCGNPLRVTPIITDYFRQTQAMIRFQLEDLLCLEDKKEVGPCPCGSKKQVVKMIEGRTDEILEIAGKILYPDFLRHGVQNALVEARDFCVVQREQHLEVKVEGPEMAKVAIKIKENLRALVPESVDVVVSFGFQRSLGEKRRRIFKVRKEQ